jgi:hypothetical protein
MNTCSRAVCVTVFDSNKTGTCPHMSAKLLNIKFYLKRMLSSSRVVRCGQTDMCNFPLECAIKETYLCARQRSRYSDWLWAGWQRGRSSSPGRVKNFLFFTSSRPALGSTQPPIQWVRGTPSPGEKRQGREADHWPPTSAEVKKIRIYTSTPPYAFIA